jgi:hypothetical protein
MNAFATAVEALETQSKRGLGFRVKGLGLKVFLNPCCGSP